MKIKIYRPMITLNYLLSTLALHGVSFVMCCTKECQTLRGLWPWKRVQLHMKALRLYAYTSTRHFKLKAKHNRITWSSTVIVCLGKIGIPVYTMSYPKEPPIEPTQLTLPLKPSSPADSTTTSQTEDVHSVILKRHS